MDYIEFCRNYSEISGLPLTLMRGEEVEYSTIAEQLSVREVPRRDLFPMDHNPSFCVGAADTLYGRVQINTTDYNIIIGPVFSVPPSDELIRRIALDLCLSVDKHELFSEILYHIPTTSPLKLGKHMSMIHLALNREKIELSDLYAGNVAEMPVKKSEAAHMDHLENGMLHNVYYFELGLYQCIRDGSVEKLQAFLRENMTLDLYEGRLAASPLRHAKNIFIVTASRACMIGAIPGGVDIDMACHLLNDYIQTCEQLTNIEAINHLQYVMLMDFCRRAGEARVPDGISSDVFVAINYIKAHVNEPMTVDSIARQIHRSSSYLSKKFRAELNTSVNAYILKARLEESVSMLVYTDKALSEISSFLCFSSLSYFQICFKKHFGETPMQYRRRNRNVCR